MKENMSTSNKTRTSNRENEDSQRQGDQEQQEQAHSQTGVTPDERHERIALVAYYKAQRRGFHNSGELEDWLAAEREIDEGKEPLPTPGEEEQPR